MTACVCGCGVELTGRQERYASNHCRHRYLYRKHKDRRNAARLMRRRERKAAAILATTVQPCENLRRRGACWIYPEGCASAKASGRCTYRPRLPSVDQVLALPPGRVRRSPVTQPCVCAVCGVEFQGTRKAKFCGNACRCRDYWVGRRERDGRKEKSKNLPANPIEDGRRRCRWCQVEIEGYAKRTTCCRRHIEMVNDHNAGRSYSSTILSRRL